MKSKKKLKPFHDRREPRGICFTTGKKTAIESSFCVSQRKKIIVAGCMDE